MGEDEFAKFITCLVKNYSQEDHNYLIKDMSRIQILYNQNNELDEKWFDESFHKNMEINFKNCKSQDRVLSKEELFQFISRSLKDSEKKNFKT